MVPKEAVVEVEIVRLPRPAPMPKVPDRGTARPRDPAPIAPATPGAAGEPSRMIEAHSFHAAQALADPRSRRALVEWRKLFPDERIIQLCNLEAMEQLHSWKPELEPRSVVAYAFEDIRLSGEKLDAEGAAIRIARKWVAISYHCRVAPDMESVVAFAFAMGEEIPESEWEAHMLPAGDDEPD